MTAFTLSHFLEFMQNNAQGMFDQKEMGNYGVLNIKGVMNWLFKFYYIVV